MSSAVIDCPRLAFRGGWVALAVLVLLILFVPDRTPGFFGTIRLRLLFAALAVGALIGLIMGGLVYFAESGSLRANERKAAVVNEAETTALTMDTKAARHYLRNAKTKAALAPHHRPEEFSTVG